MTTTSTAKKFSHSPSPLQSRSPYQSPANESDFDNLPNLQKQSALSLIQHLQGQNQQIKGQCTNLANQLKSLNSMSTNILEQNRKMREMYYERNNDVQKIISTMQIEMNEQCQDFLHQIFLAKQGNSLLVKQIEILHAELTVKDQAIMKIDEEKANIDANALSIVQEKIQLTNARIQSYFSQDHVSKLSRKQQKITDEVHQLTNQVQMLAESVNQIFLKNKKDIEKVTLQVSANQIDSAHYKNNIVFNLSSLKEIKRQNEQLKVDLKGQIELNQTLAKRLDNNRKDASEAKSEHTVSSLQDEQIKRDSDSIREKIKMLVTQQQKKQVEKYQKQQLKEALLLAIQKRKKFIRQTKQKHCRNVENIREKHAQVLSKVQKQISKQESQTADQIRKISSQKERISPLTEMSRQEYYQIEKDVQKYREMVSSLDNPATEIQKTQFTLNINGNRKPLGVLFGSG